MEATYNMANLFLAALTTQVESSMNITNVMIIVIALILILVLFFYIRLISKNYESEIFDMKKEQDENKKRLLYIEGKYEEIQKKLDSP